MLFRSGLGTQVLATQIAQVRDWGHASLMTSWVQGARSPEPFYLCHGFVPTGDLEDNEVVARVRL